MPANVLRGIFYLLIIVMVGEGIIRKLLPGAAGNAFIFVKDGLAAVLLGLALSQRLPVAARPLMHFWVVLAGALVPLWLVTALEDPVLSIFGWKQYMLFIGVALLLPKAFGGPQVEQHIRPLFMFMAALIVPTTALALLQLGLSPQHWLNLSVAGEDLSGFSAGGKLRVSSSFPFVAQYCWFLVFAGGLVAYALCFHRKAKGWRLLLHPWVVLPAYIVANFITGSRQSVLGSMLVLFLAAGLILIRSKTRSLVWLIGLVFALPVVLFATQKLFPDAFVAYEVRTGGELLGERHTQELAGRMDYALTGWTYLLRDPEVGLFGYGLGVMSNGVQKLSSYAAEVRERVGWGEADMANTVLEGGVYLILIWMAFRVAVIVYCLRLFFYIQLTPYLVVAAFFLGYVILMGLTGTLGIQPPLQIWWWLAVGAVILLAEADVRHRKHVQTMAAKKASESADP